MSEVDGEMMVSDGFTQLLADIRTIIIETHRSVYAGINALQIDHNWNIGRWIVEEEQGGKLRAKYDKGSHCETFCTHVCRI